MRDGLVVGREKTDRTAAPGAIAAGLALLAVCLLLNLSGTALPGPGLDPSWQLAAEYAARHGLVFGRDFVFTYGPYHYLADHLFDPATYGLVLLYDVLAVLAVFWVPLANRSPPALFGLGVSFVLLQIAADAINALTLFAAFLFCLKRRDGWSVAAAALCAPLALAKYSFGLVILPLLLLADLDRLAARRAPLLTLAFLAAALLADAAAGQPLSALGDLVRNTLEIVLGYGRAMQLRGPLGELALALALAALAAGFVGCIAWTQWRTSDEAGRGDPAPLAAALGLAWTLFVLVKMGFVRQDMHPFIFHQAAAASFALAFAFLDRPGRIGPTARAAFLAIFVLMSCDALYWCAREKVFGPERNMARAAGAVLDQVPMRLKIGLEWASGRRYGEMTQARTAALAGLKREFGAQVRGRVDAIPVDLAPLIASGLDYAPRPVIQSYSSYTPVLQSLDKAHFEGPGAPDTLLLNIDDIDGRLPTLALGPSLPVIGRRYDAVGVDPVGLVLRRRAEPRAVESRIGPALPLPLDRWTPAPGRPGVLLMAHIKVGRTLAGRLAGFLLREPLMQIDLRTADGSVSSYRFVPDMATLGVAISPLPRSWAQAALPLLDPSSSRPSQPVTAIRISTNGKNWAFGRPTVAYEAVRLAPGFAAGAPASIGGSRDVAALLKSLGVSVDREEADGPPFRTPVAPADPALCRGWLDWLKPAPDTVALWQATGWGWDAVDGRTFDRVLLVDDAGRLLGGGVTGLARGDVPKADPGVRSGVTGWTGAALRGHGGRLIAYGILNDGRACEIGRKDWP